MELTMAISGGMLSVTKKTKSGIAPTTINAEFMNLNAGRYTIDVRKILQKRTVQQNRYLWACYGMIAVEVGYISPEMDKSDKAEIVDALHEVFKERYLSKKTIRSPKDGRKRLKIKGSTKVLDTMEFTQYIEKIRAKHPYLPTPEDKNLMEFMERYYFQ